MGKIYKGSFVNTQVNYSDNSPNEQTIYVTITDTAPADPLPYGFHFYSDPSIGDGDQLMNLSWIGLPIDTTSLIIGYSIAGDNSYTDITINDPLPTSFYQWIVPFDDYDIRIQVVRSAGPTETYYIEFEGIVALELADAPIVLQTVDNSEDKFTPIKSKSCRIRVFTNKLVNAMTFSNGGDNEYLVQVAVNAEDAVIYSGWLSISDLGQTFQPDPNVLELIASDGIAFLRDLTLSDSESRSLTGPHQLIKYIAWCLQKTGLQLEIWVEMNLLEVSATYDLATDHFYNMLYLNAQTFETSIGELENCFSVLEKLLKEFCDISQQNNVWFIRSTDEAHYAIKKVCKFTSNGDVIGYYYPYLVKDIGADYDMAFMNDDARLSLQRPYKAVKHTFDYNYPTEIVQNIDFERGTATTEPDPTQPTSTGVYRPEGWTLARAGDGTGGVWLDLYQQAGAKGEIVKQFSYGFETSKYLVVQHNDVAGTDFIHYVKSSPFYVQKGDRLEISVDVGQDVNLNIVNPVHVWLEADTNYYTWQYDNTNPSAIVNQWVSKPKPLTAAIADNPFTQMWRTTLDSSLDPTDELPKYTTVNSTIEVPADGRIWIRLAVNFNIFAPFYFNNLRINLTPRVNGSYAVLKGQQHISEQQVDNMAVREETVFMSDAPRIEMKGALLLTELGDTLYNGNAVFADGYGVNLDGFYTPYFNINDYVDVSFTSLNNGKYRIVAVEYALIPNKTILTFAEPTQSEIVGAAQIKAYDYTLSGNFYDSIEFQGNPPQEDQLPYGQHQNQAVWNQYNRVFTAFEATVDGLDTEKTYDNMPDLPDLWHVYRQKDTHPATTNKVFKLLHYEQDTDNCEWGLYMIEVYDSTIPKTYNGHSFKYIQE
jgi:hypothetical protein